MTGGDVRFTTKDIIELVEEIEAVLVVVITTAAVVIFDFLIFFFQIFYTAFALSASTE